jgi:hypothetical protein
MKKRRFAGGGAASDSDSKPPKKDYSDRGFGGPGDDRYGNKAKQVDDDAPNTSQSRPSSADAFTKANGTGLGLGKRRDYMINKAIDDATNGVETPQGGGMKKGGAAKGKHGSGGGLGALAALQGAMAGAGGGAPGGAPMGPPPGAGGPPPGPPGGGMPPPGMKKGGKVKEDLHMKQDNHKTKEFADSGKDQKEDKGSKSGDFKYAKGGVTTRGADAKVDEKGSALMKNRPVTEHIKEEKGSSKGEFKYAKGGHVSGFRGSAHGIESKGKTKGRCI